MFYSQMIFDGDQKVDERIFHDTAPLNRLINFDQYILILL